MHKHNIHTLKLTNFVILNENKNKLHFKFDYSTQVCLPIHKNIITVAYYYT